MPQNETKSSLTLTINFTQFEWSWIISNRPHRHYTSLYIYVYWNNP